MTAPGAWAADPPEINSAGFWLGPGGESFMAAAENLLMVASGLIANLGGQEAINAALAISWPDPTGELAVLAKVPLMLWQAAAAAHMSASASAIQQVAMAFEALKAATPTPVEIGENQSENLTLNALNFCGFLTPAIVANRAHYADMWVTAASNKYAYATASTPVQSIPPMPEPTPAGTPGGATPSMSAPPEKSAQDLLSGGGSDAMSMFMGPLSQVGGLAGQLGGGGQFASLPQQAFQPFMSMLNGGGLGSSLNPSSEAMSAASAADWLSATPAAGGPVAANLVSGGGGGGVGALGALRGPAGFAATPTVNAAAVNPEGTLSRINEARAASGAPVSSAGMGSSGAMMGPMGHAGGDHGKEQSKRKTPLTSLAALYRAPTTVPVITGTGGAVFRPGEGVDTRTT